MAAALDRAKSERTMAGTSSRRRQTTSRLIFELRYFPRVPANYISDSSLRAQPARHPVFTNPPQEFCYAARGTKDAIRETARGGSQVPVRLRAIIGAYARKPLTSQ